MKKIAVGDLGEFWYGDYKEPFEQLEGGVPGHPVGVVLKADDGKLLCAWCGKTYENLGGHVTRAHKTTAAAYKREVGLLQRSALVSERLRLVRIADGLRNRETVRAAQNRSYSVADRRSVQPAGDANGMWSPEKLNQHGRCYAQALATARSIIAGGHRLTRDRLMAHGVTPRVTRRYFGSLEALRRQLDQPVGKVPRYGDLELIALLRNFAEAEGRTPTISDLERHGLPTNVTYAAHFGSYANACRLAGLDPNLPIPKDGAFDLRALTAFAAMGSTKKVASHLHVDQPAVAAVFGRYGCPFPPYGSVKQRREWAADMARRLAGVQDQAA